MTFTHPSSFTITQLTITGRPHGVSVSKNGIFYVSQIDAGQATKGTIQSSGSQLVGPVPVGATPAHIAINRSGTTAYTANQSGNSVSVIDVASNTTVATVPLSNSGFNVLVSADGNTVFATTASGLVHVIDAASRTVSWTVQVGASANGLAQDTIHNLLYVSSISAGTISAVNLQTHAVTRTYTTSGSAQRIALKPDETEIYVATEAAGLEIVNVASGNRQTVSIAGGAGSVGLAVSPDGAQVWITNPPAGRVDVYDVASKAVVKSLTLGQPRNVTFDYTGSTAVIADESGTVRFVH